MHQQRAAAAFAGHGLGDHTCRWGGGIGLVKINHGVPRGAGKAGFRQGGLILSGRFEAWIQSRWPPGFLQEIQPEEEMLAVDRCGPGPVPGVQPV
jgi:hypothetical protein